jgi:hypothetical protein
MSSLCGVASSQMWCKRARRRSCWSSRRAHRHGRDPVLCIVAVVECGGRGCRRKQLARQGWVRQRRRGSSPSTRAAAVLNPVLMRGTHSGVRQQTRVEGGVGRDGTTTQPNLKAPPRVLSLQCSFSGGFLCKRVSCNCCLVGLIAYKP